MDEVSRIRWAELMSSSQRGETFRERLGLGLGVAVRRPRNQRYGGPTGGSMIAR